MKKFAWILLIALAIGLVISVGIGFADGPPVPPPGPGAGAGKYVATPIGGGLVLLGVLGYGIYRARREKN